MSTESAMCRSPSIRVVFGEIVTPSFDSCMNQPQNKSIWNRAASEAQVSRLRSMQPSSRETCPSKSALSLASASSIHALMFFTTTAPDEVEFIALDPPFGVGIVEQAAQFFGSEIITNDTKRCLASAQCRHGHWFPYGRQLVCF